MTVGPPLRWGVLGGSARISRRGFLPGVAAAGNGELTAVGSRTGATSYQDVLDDPDVDAVYIALPNALHHEWTIKALRSGKHVLCEKPLTTSAVAAADIAATADAAGLVVMEAFMYRFHPQYADPGWPRLLESLGPLCAATVQFSEPMTTPGDIREDPALGGGALWDIGCYCLDLVCRLFGDVADVHAVGNRRLDCDWSTSVQLRFAGDALVSCWWSFSGPQWQRAVLVGERGTLTLYDPFRPNGRCTAVLEVDGVVTPVSVGGDDCFRREIEHFGEVASGAVTSSVPLAGSCSWIDVAETIDAQLRTSPLSALQVP